MIAVAGAAIVFATFSSDKAGFSRSLASFEMTKTIRTGLQLALVGPSLAMSHASRSTASGTGSSRQ